MSAWRFVALAYHFSRPYMLICISLAVFMPLSSILLLDGPGGDGTCDHGRMFLVVFASALNFQQHIHFQSLPL